MVDINCIVINALAVSCSLCSFFAVTDFFCRCLFLGTIGGVYGCDIFDSMMDQGYLVDDDGQINLCKNWIFYMKEFYRLDYLMPYSNCTYTDTVPPQELTCGYTCNEDLTEDFVFELKNILNSDNDCIPYDLQDAGWYAWRDFICTGDGYKLFGGDHLEAASPADPSFWPIHPTLERLLQAKYMAGELTLFGFTLGPHYFFLMLSIRCYCLSGAMHDDQNYLLSYFSFYPAISSRLLPQYFS